MLEAKYGDNLWTIKLITMKIEEQLKIISFKTVFISFKYLLKLL